MASSPVEQTSDSLQKLKLESQSKPAEKAEAGPGHDSSVCKSADASNALLVPEMAKIYGVQDGMSDSGIYYAPNGYGPHGFIYDISQAGYESTVGEWEDYPRYVGLDGVEIHSGFYGENGPVLFHQPGYAYTPQAAFGAYSPAAQMPTMGADGQLYGPSAFQYCGPIYQQALPPGAPYFPPPSVIASEGPVTSDATSQRTDAALAAAPNNNVLASGPRPGLPLAMMPPHSPHPRGVFPLNVHNSGSQDVRQGFNSFRGNPANSSKKIDGQPRSFQSRAMPTVSSPPLPIPGHPTQQLRPPIQTQVQLPVPQPPRPTRALSPGLGPGYLGRGYSPLSRGIPSQSGTRRAGRGDMDLRANGNGHTWFGDKNKVRERAFEQLSNGSSNGSAPMNGHMDVLNEQNRGPRISRMRNPRATPSVVNQIKDQNGHALGNGDTATYLHREEYNQADFPTSYSDAKFFVIKSYSEDDVHKSIKYQVWTSTPNGNKRLDMAYQEAQARVAGKELICPVFLFFSVNASGQFCGVAEMTGPVDFMKSVDYWQQDKWSGQFPVKWHIIKDVPNSQFRHIILENNDNKPVTNSRDTQEVKFEYGLEMLNIFKNYLSKTSILDDFQFYDDRQRVMQEKKNMLHSQQVRDGEHAELRIFEASLKPETERGTELMGNESAVAGISATGSATTGLVSPDKVSTTDSAASKDREVAVSELNSKTMQKDALEVSLQRKSYLRSLKEGKSENGSAVIAPAKSVDVKGSFDEKKVLVANRTAAETK